jgi:NADP-dependent 3-hydroxy acid dehydrogenase YdfG/acyl carrier protein
MAQAKHVGKVVLDMQDVEARVALARRPGVALRARGTYLVTGGLGGLGLAVARWMVGEGARHLVLLGRNGPSPEAESRLAEMREAGARVVVIRADVSEPAEVAAALSEIRGTLPRLRGVVHAAGRLDDGLLSDLDQGRLRSVMAPKADGAWNLHVHTLARPLDFFVLFSSAASILGSPGQANYAAANSFLDALAHHRRSLGLAGQTINWGPWSEVGLAARPDRGGRLASGGIGSLSPAEGVAALGRLLRTGATQVCVMPVDWPAWQRSAGAGGSMPLVSAFVGGGGGTPDAAPAAGKDLTAAILAAAPAQRQPLLEKHLQDQVARVMRFPPSKLDVNRPLSTLGIDSLMAVELKNRIEAELKVALPLIQLVQGPSVSELAEILLAQMAAGDAAAAPRPAPAPPAPRGRDSLLLSLLSLGKGKDERDA